ncbi:MAG TPA: TonB-dependent receptor plug domain-containing protein [Bacteroidales bacterium]|nr:TonB-dependent receptor plug domain-containing protein [Bacteroidales bacterium]
MKGLFFILFLLLGFLLNAQQQNDTIWLKPVDISAPADDSVFMISVSGKLIPADENLSIENALSRYSPVFFKTYSPGGIASISHRGFGASQTLFVWNGFALNQLTLGQPALNGMQVNENMHFGIVSGTLAASDFSGGLSSYIYVDDGFYRDSSLMRRLVISGGSFGAGSASFFSDYRIKKSRVSFELSGMNVVNNYRFHNNAEGAGVEQWPLQNRVNASYFGMTVKSNLLIPLKNGDFKFSLWAGSQFNESPAQLLSPQLSDNESQENRFVRMSGFVPLLTAADAGLQIRFFFSADTFLYRNKQLSISDGTASQTLATRWNAYLRAGAGHEFKFEYYPEFNRVLSENFSKPVLSTDQRLNLNYCLNRSDVVKAIIWTHFITRNFDELFPLPGLSLSFMPGNSSKANWKRLKWLSVNAGIARNMRMPTMNDLFWEPGGNPYLKPEDAWMADMAIVASSAFKKIKWDFKVMPFFSETFNLIRWTPDSLSSQWIASNVSESRQYGVEGVAACSYSWQQNTITGSMNVTRVFAQDMSGDKVFTLMYVPDKTMNSSVSFEHGIWSGGYEFHYTGKRYSSSDNDRYMPEIFLHDVFFSVVKKIKSDQLSLSLRFNNIMNADYQYIAWYPMPRRNFHVTLKWKWNE